MSLLGVLSLEFVVIVFTAILSVIGYYFHLLRRFLQAIRRLLQGKHPVPEHSGYPGESRED